MKRNLCERLERLEQAKAVADRAKAASTPPSGPSTAEIIRERLRVSGYVQTGNESLAETLARAFGMNSQELRYLMAGPVAEFNAKLRSL